MFICCVQVSHGCITPAKFGMTGNGNVSADSGADQDSIHSVEGDGSVTDSGRGPSEEGEAAIGSSSAIAVSAGSYVTSGVAGPRPPSVGGHQQSQQRERYLPPPPPPPRPGAAYWALHHHQPPAQQQQQSPAQPAVLIGGGHYQHHRGPPQSHPTVRFHGLSTTIPEDEMLGDCFPPTGCDDGIAGLPSSLGRPGRQAGRRGVSTAATSGGNRSNYVGRQRTARVYNTSPDAEVGCAGAESDAHALLPGRKLTSGQNDCDNRSVEMMAASPRQPNGHVTGVGGGAGWTYRDNSVIV